VDFYLVGPSCLLNMKAVCFGREIPDDENMFKEITASDGQVLTLNLKAANGQVIGTSEMYSATSAMETE